MSGALYSWYSLPDLMSLAERGAVLEGTIELAKFERLKGLLNSTDGSASARLTFRRRNDQVLMLELQCAASVELVCQRCLEPVVHDVRETVEFVVADDEQPLAALPNGMNLVALAGDRFQPAGLIEDELIVSLPLVPKHDDQSIREN